MAYEIWNDLKERFFQKNGPRIFQLQNSIFVLSQGKISINAYFRRLKALWDELINYKPIPVCSCGAIHTINSYVQYERIIQFLVGLNESYSSIRAQILLMEPLPFLNRVYSLVLQEEQQHEISILPISSSENHAFAVKVDDPRLARSMSKKERPLCKHCSVIGHVLEKCFKLHRYPPGYKLKQGSSPW